MSMLDLEKQLTFYGAYHHNGINIAIHMVCVPLILVTFFTLSTNIGPFYHPPPWLSIPYLEANLGTFFAFLWGGLYVLLEPVAGTALAILCVLSSVVGNQLRIANPTATNQWSIAVFLVSWVAQFIGHGKFEGRAPALLDNVFQAFFLAPLFVWLELLFMMGYRPNLKARVDKAAAAEVAKFRQQQTLKNGKAQ